MSVPVLEEREGKGFIYLLLYFTSTHTPEEIQLRTAATLEVPNLVVWSTSSLANHGGKVEWKDLVVDKEWGQHGHNLMNITAKHYGPQSLMA